MHPINPVITYFAIFLNTLTPIVTTITAVATASANGRTVAIAERASVEAVESAVDSADVIALIPVAPSILKPPLVLEITYI